MDARSELDQIRQRAENATTCGHEVPVQDGWVEPCGRPATSWRWYQDVEHEDCLERSCDLHENKGGVLMGSMVAALTAALDLADEYERDDREHLDRFGQHHPVAYHPYPRIRAAITDHLTNGEPR